MSDVLWLNRLLPPTAEESLFEAVLKLLILDIGPLFPGTLAEPPLKDGGTLAEPPLKDGVWPPKPIAFFALGPPRDS